MIEIILLIIVSAACGAGGAHYYRRLREKLAEKKARLAELMRSPVDEMHLLDARRNELNLEIEMIESQIETKQLELDSAMQVEAHLSPTFPALRARRRARAALPSPPPPADGEAPRRTGRRPRRRRSGNDSDDT